MLSEISIFGKAKLWQSRLGGYLSIINFCMLFFLYIIESPMNLEWYQWLIIIITGLSVVIYVDMKYILPSEATYSSLKNPFLVDMKKEINRCNRKLDMIISKMR